MYYLQTIALLCSLVHEPRCANQMIGCYLTVGHGKERGVKHCWRQLYEPEMKVGVKEAGK